MSEALACDYCFQVFHPSLLLSVADEYTWRSEFTGIGVMPDSIIAQVPEFDRQIAVSITTHWKGNHVCEQCRKILVYAVIKACAQTFSNRWWAVKEAAREAELKPVSDAVKATWKGTNPDALPAEKPTGDS